MIIPIAFTLLSILTLWFVIGARGYWFLKMICISLTLCFAVLFSSFIRDLSGWPADSPLPARFQLYWAIIKEPDKKGDDPGGIYLWLRDLDNEDTKEPRAYKTPYTQEDHEKIQGALGMIKSGKQVQGGMGGKGGKGSGNGKQQGNGGDEGGGSLSNSPELYFEELPPPKLPDKR